MSELVDSMYCTVHTNRTVNPPLNPNLENHNKTMDKVIIDAWERWLVWEDDDAYEGCISLGTPNDVSAAYEREVQRAAVAVRPSSRRQSGSFDGQHIPPTVPP